MKHHESVVVTYADLDGATGTVEDIAKRKGGVPDHATLIGTEVSFIGGDEVLHFAWDPPVERIEEPFEGGDPIYIAGVSV